MFQITSCCCGLQEKNYNISFTLCQHVYQTHNRDFLVFICFFLCLGKNNKVAVARQPPKSFCMRPMRKNPHYFCSSAFKNWNPDNATQRVLFNVTLLQYLQHKPAFVFTLIFRHCPSSVSLVLALSILTMFIITITWQSWNNANYESMSDQTTGTTSVKEVIG